MNPSETRVTYPFPPSKNGFSMCVNLLPKLGFYLGLTTNNVLSCVLIYPILSGRFWCSTLRIDIEPSVPVTVWAQPPEFHFYKFDFCMKIIQYLHSQLCVLTCYICICNSKLIVTHHGGINNLDDVNAQTFG